MKKKTITNHIEKLNDIYIYKYYWTRKNKIEKGNFNTELYIKYLNYLRNI